MELIDKVVLNEYSLNNLYSKVNRYEYFDYYYDDLLKDMYDHNFFFLKSEFNEIVLSKIETISKQNNSQHIKIVSFDPVDVLVSKYKFENGINLVMACECSKIQEQEIFSKLIFKDSVSNPSINKDILSIELKHYGKTYGKDFTERKMNRLFMLSNQNNDFKFIAAYFNGQIVGYCHIFINHNVIALDSLLVDINFRNKGIASSIIKFIFNSYELPIYLHADNDDTPKLLYNKLGFITLYQNYEYLLIHRK